MDEFKRQAVAVSLHHMVKGGYFDMTTIRKCVETLGIVPPQGDMDALAVLHCIRWTEMPEGYIPPQ